MASLSRVLPMGSVAQAAPAPVAKSLTKDKIVKVTLAIFAGLSIATAFAGIPLMVIGSHPISTLFYCGYGVTAGGLAGLGLTVSGFHIYQGREYSRQENQREIDRERRGLTRAREFEEGLVARAEAMGPIRLGRRKTNLTQDEMDTMIRDIRWALTCQDPAFAMRANCYLDCYTAEVLFNIYKRLPSEIRTQIEDKGLASIFFPPPPKINTKLTEDKMDEMREVMQLGFALEGPEFAEWITRHLSCYTADVLSDIHGRLPSEIQTQIQEKGLASIFPPLAPSPKEG